jgi:hypothetical protein
MVLDCPATSLTGMETSVPPPRVRTGWCVVLTRSPTLTWPSPSRSTWTRTPYVLRGSYVSTGMANVTASPAGGGTVTFASVVPAMTVAEASARETSSTRTWIVAGGPSGTCSGNTIVPVTVTGSAIVSLSARVEVTGSGAGVLCALASGAAVRLTATSAALAKATGQNASRRENRVPGMMGAPHPHYLPCDRRGEGLRTDRDAFGHHTSRVLDRPSCSGMGQRRE